MQRDARVREAFFGTLGRGVGSNAARRIVERAGVMRWTSARRLLGPSHASIVTSFRRPDAPLLIDTSALRHRK